MIDSHCHIDLVNTDAEAIIKRAEQAGIERLLSVACSIGEYDDLLRLLQLYPMVDGAFGIHPEYAASLPADSDFKQKVLAHPRIVAVGECGLDFHYMAEQKDTQCQAFERQLELAHDLHKPIIIHTREADSETIEILKTADRGGLLKAGGVLHCFTGSLALAEKALEMGLYISASGVITFKTADSVRQVIQTIPLDRLLIETDSPYMAPVPYRGHENEPAYIVKTAEKLAELKDVSVSEIEKITTENYYRLFHQKGGV